MQFHKTTPVTPMWAIDKDLSTIYIKLKIVQNFFEINQKISISKNFVSFFFVRGLRSRFLLSSDSLNRKFAFAQLEGSTLT